MIENFNNEDDRSLFLVAGGVGLNLTGANVVIIQQRPPPVKKNKTPARRQSRTTSQSSHGLINIPEPSALVELLDANVVGQETAKNPCCWYLLPHKTNPD